MAKAILTGPQCRAARALIELAPEPVAERAGLSVEALLAFETRAADLGEDAQRRLVVALEEGGAVLIPENGGGRGVRLKYTRGDVRGVNRWEAEGGRAGEDDV